MLCSEPIPGGHAGMALKPRPNLSIVRRGDRRKESAKAAPVTRISTSCRANLVNVDV